MAEVVLFRPKTCGIREEQPESRPPTGLLYIAAPLVQNGIQVTIIDQSVEKDWESKLAACVDSTTLCVGITSLTGNMITNGIEIVKRVRTLSDCPVVWGGVHPTLEPESTIASQYVDIIVIGEGEDTFLELVLALKDKKSLADVDGIYFKEDGAVRTTRPRVSFDLNNLPILPFQLINFEYYRGHAMLSRFFNFTSPLAVSLETSRGCTHKCTYCVMASDNYSQKSKWKGMSAGKLADMTENIVRTYGITAFSYIDDNFFVNIKRVEAFLDELEKRNLKIEWFADVRMDTIVRNIGEPLIKRLEQSGLRSLGIGVESGSNEILAFLRKGETQETFIKANRILATTGIKAQYGFIQGLPTEKLADTKQTYFLVAKFLKENPNAMPSINKLLPTPRTPLLEECKKLGLIVPDTFEDWVKYCDVRWAHGADVWMDREAADFITSQLYYNELISLARGRQKKLFVFELALKICTSILMFRLTTNIFSFPFERWLYVIAKKPIILQILRKLKNI